MRAADITGLTFINPNGLCDPRPNAYSHLAVFPAGWRMILPAGQGGETEDGALADDFATRLWQALRNPETVLAAAGATMSDVAKVNDGPQFDGHDVVFGAAAVGESGRVAADEWVSIRPRPSTTITDRARCSRPGCR